MDVADRLLEMRARNLTVTILDWLVWNATTFGSVTPLSADLGATTISLLLNKSELALAITYLRSLRRALHGLSSLWVPQRVACYLELSLIRIMGFRFGLIQPILEAKSFWADGRGMSSQCSIQRQDCTTRE